MIARDAEVGASRVFFKSFFRRICCVMQAGKALLKSEYEEGASVEACLKLAVKVLNKTMDSTTPTPEKMEFTTITRVDGKVCGKFVVLSSSPPCFGWVRGVVKSPLGIRPSAASGACAWFASSSQ